MLSALLQPQPTVPAGLVRPDDVGGRAAWQALLLDGLLTPVWGDAALPGHVPPAPEFRAEALADGLLPRTVVGRHTALWVLTGFAMCRSIHLLYSPSQHRPRPRAETRTHQATLEADDVTTIQGVPLTTGVRIAFDLVLHDDRRSAIVGLRHLKASGLVTANAVRTRLDRTSHRRRIREAHDIVAYALD